MFSHSYHSMLLFGICIYYVGPLVVRNLKQLHILLPIQLGTHLQIQQYLEYLELNEACSPNVCQSVPQSVGHMVRNGWPANVGKCCTKLCVKREECF